MVMVIYILSFPKNFVEGPLHGACLWVTPPWVATSWFVSVCLARCASFRCVLWRARKLKQRREEGAETLHARQRMRKQALWDESNRASNVRTLVFIKTVQGNSERQQKNSHTGQELTEHVWKWAATSRKALNSIKNGKEIQAKIKKMTKPLANKHSIKSQKTDVIWFIFFLVSLWSSFCTQWPRGRPLSCESPGCAACSGMRAFIYGCASCTFALGLWQMLDADGWCLMMVLYMVLSDILAERRMARRTQVRWKGCFTFIGASLADSGLRQNGLFLWWLCMLSFLSFCIWQRRGKLKREGGEGAEKDSMHTSRHRKKATEDDSNLPHTPAS